MKERRKKEKKREKERKGRTKMPKTKFRMEGNKDKRCTASQNNSGEALKHFNFTVPLS